MVRQQIANLFRPYTGVWEFESPPLRHTAG